jgi:hypothetical protein
MLFNDISETCKDCRQNCSLEFGQEPSPKEGLLQSPEGPRAYLNFEKNVMLFLNVLIHHFKHAKHKSFRKMQMNRKKRLKKPQPHVTKLFRYIIY